MSFELLSHGAESLIFCDENVVYKFRLPKLYRIPEIDTSIALKRTSSETRILSYLRSCSLLVPALVKPDFLQIQQFVDENFNGTKKNDLQSDSQNDISLSPRQHRVGFSSKQKINGLDSQSNDSMPVGRQETVSIKDSMPVGEQKTVSINSDGNSHLQDCVHVSDGVRFTLNTKNTICMERISGVTLKEFLTSNINNLDVMKDIISNFAEYILKMHESNIIHGDLTTSNFLVCDGLLVCGIDFGLSYKSSKAEDKAVDLYVFEKALKCDFECYLVLLEWFYSVYSDALVLKRLESVRLRGRKREECAIG